MPLYVYRCIGPDHHVKEHLVKISGGDAPKVCAAPVVIEPHGDGGAVHVACGALLERLLSAPASIFPGASSWQK